MAAQLEAKKVRITLSSDARDWLAEKGFDPLFGARPMARLIQHELKKQLADRILFGDLKSGGNVDVIVKDGKLDLLLAS
jgi:ATP-dependent Clp protease ATP-binding subunit ClpA